MVVAGQHDDIGRLACVLQNPRLGHTILLMNSVVALTVGGGVFGSSNVSNGQNSSFGHLTPSAVMIGGYMNALRARLVCVRIKRG